MITNILIGWNVILTILFIIIVVNNGERQARIDKIELDIKQNGVYDIIVEEEAAYYHPSYFDDYKQRVVTMKEAIACLYKKHNFRLSYTPEKTEMTSEDVSIK